MILGPSIEPEKVTVKSASTPYPLQNDHFIVFLIIRDPILLLNHFFKIFIDSMGYKISIASVLRTPFLEV
jgi:hypothetical protein